MQDIQKIAEHFKKDTAIQERINDLTVLIYELETTTSKKRYELEVLKASSNSRVEICIQCGWVWTPRDENPDRCPKCKSKYWCLPKRSYTCKKCGHHWHPKFLERKPKSCPKCRTEKWNEPRRQK